MLTAKSLRRRTCRLTTHTGSLNVTVADQCFVTCPQTKTKVILHYLEEGWLGKTQNKVEGVVYTYNPDTDNITRIKDVPSDKVLARIEGVWVDKIYYTIGKEDFSKNKEKILLANMAPLTVVPKTVPELDVQLPNESRKFWHDVTASIKGRQYTLATNLKQEIEEKQRAKATERKEKNEEWQPRFFTGAVTPAGKPELTEDGKRAVQGINVGDYKLEENKVYGA